MNQTVSEKINIFKSKIADIAAVEGINSDNIHLVAISKRQPIEKIIEAENSGIKYFGENKVQEFIDKFDRIQLKSEWHFVGHLQTNKVKNILNKVSLIHSVDSLRLAQKISRLSCDRNLETDCLIQVNTSGEESKYGFDEMGFNDQIEEINKLDNIRIMGLMTMAPFTENIKVITQSFSKLKKLFDNLKTLDLKNFNMQYLSMGMSNDFEIAIKEGSNMLRIGTSLFGPRN